MKLTKKFNIWGSLLKMYRHLTQKDKIQRKEDIKEKKTKPYQAYTDKNCSLDLMQCSIEPPRNEDSNVRQYRISEKRGQ